MKGVVYSISIMTLFTFLFVKGAKSEEHLIFGIFLILLSFAFFLLYLFKILRDINNSIDSIEYKGDIIQFRTIEIWPFHSKVYIIKKSGFFAKYKEYNLYHEHKITWIIKVKNKEIKLFKSFFDEIVLQELNLPLGPSSVGSA
jgi:hypothetical protein